MARCGHCGKEAKGYALIDDVRYCHEGADPTCYQMAQHYHAMVNNPDVMRELLDIWGCLANREWAIEQESSNFDG